MPTSLTDDQLDDVLRAVSEPRRRAILSLLATKELPAGAIAAEFPGISRPAVSQHLAVLRDAGLLVERRDGTKRIYRTQSEALAAMQRRMAELWPTALDRFKAYAESDAAGRAHEAPQEDPS
ncbi:MAG: ArsR/SmtB family transcription factor [Aquihabitans sp.]